MLENLFNLIKEQGGDAVINNPVILNEQNDAVLASATQAVAEELQGTLAGGGLLNNPIVRNIISNFTQKLTNNHGLSGVQAGGIATNLIPDVLGNLINKTNNPNDSSFDINSIIGPLTSGAGNTQAGGGLDTDGDGKVELRDIVSKVTGNAQQAQAGSGGGLMDIIKGFMK